MLVYAATIDPIEEFCLPLLAADVTGWVRRAIDAFYATGHKPHDLKQFVLYMLNSNNNDTRQEALRYAVASMCAAKGWPLRHVLTEDESYYDFYNEPYFCPVTSH